MRSVRVFFEKKDMAKYISHLDLMRCFSRAITREQINIWYTEGYNPHAFMTFSFPLSLGVESYCESVEMRILDDMQDDEIKDRLNDALPLGIRVTKVKEPLYKSEDIAFAEYEILFNTKKNEKIKDHLQNILESDEILAEKKAKQGRHKVMKQINLKDNIISYNMSVMNFGVKMNIVLTSGNRNNINPSLVIDAISKDAADDIESTDIIKRKMFVADMKEFE